MPRIPQQQCSSTNDFDHTDHLTDGRPRSLGEAFDLMLAEIETRGAKMTKYKHIVCSGLRQLGIYFRGNPKTLTVDPETTPMYCIPSITSSGSISTFAGSRTSTVAARFLRRQRSALPPRCLHRRPDHPRGAHEPRSSHASADLWHFPHQLSRLQIERP